MVQEALACENHHSITGGSENSPRPGCCGEQTENLLGGEVGPPAVGGRDHVQGNRYQPLIFHARTRWGLDAVGWAQSHRLGFSSCEFLVAFADHLGSLISTASTLSPGLFHIQLHDCRGACLSLAILYPSSVAFRWMFAMIPLFPGEVCSLPFPMTAMAQ